MRRTFKGVILGATVILLAVGTWLGWQTYIVYSGIRHMHRVVPRLTAEPTITIPPLDGSKRYNILLLGSDNDHKIEEARPLTQSMIVVTVDPRHHRVDVLSIPRDFWVPIRGHGMAKIDLASKYGGIALARATVENLFHIPIQYYAWVGLSGFTRVIDTFHGITLNVSHPILDDFYPDDLKPSDPYAFTRVFIPPGWRHMSGRQALEYVRSRHGDLIGDFGRSARQQQVLLRLRKKVSTTNILTNLPSLVQDLQNSVRTDLDISQLYPLGQLSRRIGHSDIHKLVLSAPKYCSYDRTPDGQSILRPNWTAINPVIKALFAPIRVDLTPRPSRILAPSKPTPMAVPHPVQTPPRRSTNTPNPPYAAAPTVANPTRLPGSLIFVRDGNVFELSPSRQLRQLTNTGAIAMPSVSPDGKTIAVVRFPRQPASDVWLLDRKSGSFRELTNNTNFKTVYNNVWAAWPTWTADGKSLLFSTDIQKLPLPPTETRPVDLAIWQISNSGKSSVQLTSPVRGSGGDTDPTVLDRSGGFLYVQWNYDAQTNTPYSQIVMHEPGRSIPIELFPRGQRVIQPAISRSGKQLAYVSGSDNESQIFVAQITQSKLGPHLANARPIVRGEVAEPAISPDGRWVTFLQAEGDQFSLWMVPIQGGRAVKIEEAGTGLDAISRPIWIP